MTYLIATSANEGSPLGGLVLLGLIGWALYALFKPKKKPPVYRVDRQTRVTRVR